MITRRSTAVEFGSTHRLATRMEAEVSEDHTRQDGEARDLPPSYSAIDASSVTILRHFACSENNGMLFENDGLIAAASAVDYLGPVHNAAIRKNANEAPSEVLDTAISFFAKRSRRFVLWVSSHADGDLGDSAQSVGFRPRSLSKGAAGMYLDRPFRENRAPKGVRLLRVERDDDTTTFANIVANSFASRLAPQPAPASLSWFAHPRVLICPTVVAYLAEINGVAVGAAMILIENGVGGICWVSTLPHARGLGIARFLTAACANSGFAAGVNIVALQSSSMGEAMYARMGFREMTRYQRLLSPDICGFAENRVWR